MERTRRGLGLLLAVALVGLVAPLNAVAQEAAGAQLFGSFGGNAYGTKASANTGDVATKLGRSAYVTSGCNGTGGRVRSNTVDTVDAGKAAKAQQIYTTAYTNKTATTGVARHTSKVEGVRLLGPRVSADAVKAVARTNATATTATSNTRGSRFINLVVDGNPVASRPAEGQRIKLEGLGYLQLKDVVRGGNGTDKSTISVNMITVVVKENNRFDLPIGARIVIGHAESRFKRVEPVGVVNGAGFAAGGTSQVSEVENRLGRAAAVYLPCEGTNGRVLSNTVESIDARSPEGKVLIAAETGRSTTMGEVTDAQTLAVTTSDLVNLNLLDGAITADRVTSVARAVVDSTGGTASADGSHFEGLELGGAPFAASPPPNTRVELPGIGYVILNEQNLQSGPTRASAKVVMLHVFIDAENNALGLPVGTELIVASARSAAEPFNN